MGDGKRSATSSTGRLASVDLLRGLVMVVMVLDHVRGFFSDHLGARPPLDPTDLSRVSTGLFVTRWVTHFCAPVFVLLAGVGASLAGDRMTSKGRLAAFLVSRGLWLVVLEFTLARLGFFFSLDYHFLLGLVLWALGWSMVILAGLVFLPRWFVAAFGVALVAGHNAFDGVTQEAFGRLSWLWNFLHYIPPGPPLGVQLGGSCELFAPYKIIPWAGVMALGYALGAAYWLESSTRRLVLFSLGLAATAAFVALRWPNWVVHLPWGEWRGDPRPWSEQSDAFRTALSFVNCTKYPPSLLFLLMTLGPALAALAVFDRPSGWVGARLITIGRVPLFFYLIHAPVIHGLAIVVSLVQYGKVLPWLVAPPQFAEAPNGYGYGLAVLYLVWVLVVITLYPLCAWFAGVKQRHRSAWLSYL